MNVSYSSFILNISFEDDIDINRIINYFKLDKYFTEIYYRLGDIFVYIDPPPKISQDEYCVNCNVHGPSRHLKTCSDPFNGVYDEKFHEQVQNRVKGFNIKDKLVIKYCKDKCNIITIKNNRIIVLSNPFNSIDFYKILLGKLGLSEENITENIISSAISNINYNVVLKQNEIIDTLKNYRSHDFDNIKIMIKNNRYLIYINKIIRNRMLCHYTIQLYKNSMQITISKFYTEYIPLQDQIDLIKSLLNPLIELLDNIITKGNYFSTKTPTLKMNYNTIQGTLPYMKPALVTFKGLHKGAKGKTCKVWDQELMQWKSGAYRIEDYDPNRGLIIVRKLPGSSKTHEERILEVSPQFIGIDKESRGNQVCRDVVGSDTARHHPIPYSFYGVCPEYNQIMSPVGIQSIDDNHFYPCCREKKSSDDVMSYLMYGVSREMREEGLIPGNVKDPDLYSGIFYRNALKGSFKIMGVEGVTQGVLVGFDNRAKDKFKIETPDGRQMNISYQNIDPRLLESRAFPGIKNMKDPMGFIKGAFLHGGFYKDSLPEKYLVDTEHTLHSYTFRYMTTDDHKHHRDQDLYIMFKHGIPCVIEVERDNLNVYDKYGRHYVIPCRRSFRSFRSYGSYFDNKIYIVSGEIRSKEVRCNEIIIKFIDKCPREQLMGVMELYEDEIMIMSRIENEILIWKRISNFWDSTVFVIGTHEIIDRLNNIMQEMIKKHMTMPIDYQFVGLPMKITFDFKNTLKVVNKMKVSNEEYILYGEESEGANLDKMKFVLNYFDIKGI